jgi:hypothetical protein
MDANLTPAKIRKLTAAQALEWVHTVSLVGLAGMSREQVEALPEPARAARRQRLYDDPTMWDSEQVWTAAGVGRAGFQKWRNAYLRGEVGDDVLPKPDNEDTEDVKRPGETRARGSDRAKWQAGRMRRWLKDTERNDIDLFPRKKTSPGAPIRKPRAE